MLIEKELTEAVIQCSYKVHKALGPGLLESAYRECLYFELVNMEISVEKEKSLPLNYKGVRLDCGYRINLLIEKKVIIEIKSVESIIDRHLAQTLTYLKLSELRFGLIINFNVIRLKDGIKRVINGY